MKKIRNNELFYESLTTLLFSWGGDTPPEAVWAFNELIYWADKEFGLDIDMELEEDGSNLTEVLEKIEKKLKIKG